MDVDELINRFRYHPAVKQDTKDSHEKIRKLCLDLALELNVQLADSREKSLAMTNLEEVMFWGNAGVARYPDKH